MPVVLNAYNDRSNGYVHTLPFRQEIEVPQIKGDILSAHYTSWMQAVVPHELVHAVQAQAGGRFGIGSVVNWIAPDLARSMNFALPPGLNEGAAVYYESRVQSHAGRLNDARFQMKIKAALASPRPWSLSQLLEAPAYAGREIAIILAEQIFLHGRQSAIAVHSLAGCVSGFGKCPSD